MKLDAVERAGAGAANQQLERAAEHLRNACHCMDLAAACSDLAEPTPTMRHHAVWLQLAISRKRDAIENTLAKSMPAERPRLRVVK